MEFSQWFLIEEISGAISSVICEALSDEEYANLITRAKEGEDTALSDLWSRLEKHAKKRVSKIMRKRYDNPDVEDIVGDIMTKFIKTIQTGKLRADSPDAILSWINQAVTNEIRTQLRRQVHRNHLDIQTMLKASDQDVSHHGDERDQWRQVLGNRFKSPPDAAMSREKGDLLNLAIQDLPDRVKSTFLMHQANMPDKEIAIELGIEEPTVRYNLLQARRMLSDKMKALGLHQNESIRRYLASIG